MNSSNILVLGASGGIGSAIAEVYETRGYNVYKPTRQEYDLSTGLQVPNVKDVDIFINCVSINQTKPYDSISRDEFTHTINSNFLGFFEVVKQVTSQMRNNGGGHILNISSLYGHLSRKNRLMYATTKHAANGMIKTLALELGQYNIKVNSLSPGFVMTKMTTKNNNEEKINSWREKIPLGDLAKPEDIAKVAYFLCSPENTYITGQNIIVDGGYSIGGFES
jgi:3-oxoacyl-[acyl-carrier protein] reductase